MTPAPRGHAGIPVGSSRRWRIETMDQVTRATAASLTGDLDGALQLHAFGPVVAVALVTWSIVSIRQRRLLPTGIPAWPLGAGVIALLSYWVLRLGVSLGGWPGPELLQFPLTQLS